MNSPLWQPVSCFGVMACRFTALKQQERRITQQIVGMSPLIRSIKNQCDVWPVSPSAEGRERHSQQPSVHVKCHPQEDLTIRSLH